MITMTPYWQPRPSRIGRKKDRGYHLEFGKHCSATLYDEKYRSFIENTDINFAFFKGDQWIFEEDLQNFFLDDNGGVRSRIKVVKNMIQPMVNYYIGTMMQSQHRGKVKSVDPRAIKRKEYELRRLEAYQRLSESPELKKFIDGRVALGSDINETRQIFEAGYRDEFPDYANAMIEALEKENDINRVRIDLTKYIVLSGMCVHKSYEHNGHYSGAVVDSRQFFWDTSAQKHDLSDASYMGEWYCLDAVDIFERFRVSEADRRRIEDMISKSEINGYRSQIGSYTMPAHKPPVVEVYWKDIETVKVGWVDYGDGVFGLDRLIDGKPMQGRKLAKASDLTKSQLELSDGKVVTKREVDDIRYCVFMPSESSINTGLGQDIILEYGSLKYQDRSRQRPGESGFPYSVSTWFYDNGDVVSPIDVVINPQRMTNRMLSVYESRLNTMSGSGTVIADEAIGSMTEYELSSNVNAGKPITVSARKLGSVQNAIGNYGPDMSALNNLANNIRDFKSIYQETTGLNAEMLGMDQNNEQLVRVMAQRIDRGSILQQPVFYGVKDCLNQIYTKMLNMGRRIYSDNSRQISYDGPDGVRSIVMSKEIALEDMRVYVEVEEGKDSAIEAGNQLLFTLYSMQLISPELMGKLFGSSDVDTVSQAFYRYVHENELVQKKAAERQEAQSAAIMQGQQENQALAIAAQAEKDQADLDLKAQKLQQNERNSVRNAEIKRVKK